MTLKRKNLTILALGAVIVALLFFAFFKPMTLISASDVYIEASGYEGGDGEWKGSFWVVTFLTDCQESYLFYSFDDSESGKFGKDYIGDEKIVPTGVIEVTITPQQPYYSRALTSPTNVQVVPSVTGCYAYVDDFNGETQLRPYLFEDVSEGTGWVEVTNNKLYLYSGEGANIDFGRVKTIFEKELAKTSISFDLSGSNLGFLDFYILSSDYTDFYYLLKVSHHKNVDGEYWLGFGYPGTWVANAYESSPYKSIKIETDSTGFSSIYYSLDGSSWKLLHQRTLSFYNEIVPVYLMFSTYHSNSYSTIDNFKWVPSSFYYETPLQTYKLDVITQEFATGFWTIHTPFDITVEKTHGENRFTITQSIDTYGGTETIQLVNPYDPDEKLYLTELGKLGTGYEIGLGSQYIISGKAFDKGTNIENVVAYDSAFNSFSYHWFGNLRKNGVPTAVTNLERLTGTMPPGWIYKPEKLELYQPVQPIVDDLYTYLQSQGYSETNLDVWGQGYELSPYELKIFLPRSSVNSLVTLKISTELADSMVYSPSLPPGHIESLTWDSTGTDTIQIVSGEEETFTCLVMNDGTETGTYDITTRVIYSDEDGFTPLQTTGSVSVVPSTTSLTIDAGKPASATFTVKNLGTSSQTPFGIEVFLKDQAGNVLDTATLSGTLIPISQEAPHGIIYNSFWGNTMSNQTEIRETDTLFVVVTNVGTADGYITLELECSISSDFVHYEFTNTTRFYKAQDTEIIEIPFMNLGVSSNMRGTVTLTAITEGNVTDTETLSFTLLSYSAPTTEQTVLTVFTLDSKTGDPISAVKTTISFGDNSLVNYTINGKCSFNLTDYSGSVSVSAEETDEYFGGTEETYVTKGENHVSLYLERKPVMESSMTYVMILILVAGLILFVVTFKKVRRKMFK